MRASNFPVGAVATGLPTLADDGTVLDAWFPAPRLRADIKPSQTRRLRDHEVTGVPVTWQTDRIVKAVQLS
jgi:hypothetical protein